MMTLELPVSPPTIVPAGSQVISLCLRERACLIADSENGRAAVQSRRRPRRLQEAIQLRGFAGWLKTRAD
jgi:hypothetical protein